VDKGINFFKLFRIHNIYACRG